MGRWSMRYGKKSLVKQISFSFVFIEQIGLDSSSNFEYFHGIEKTFSSIGLSISEAVMTFLNSGGVQNKDVCVLNKVPSIMNVVFRSDHQSMRTSTRSTSNICFGNTCEWWWWSSSRWSEKKIRLWSTIIRMESIIATTSFVLETITWTDLSNQRSLNWWSTNMLVRNIVIIRRRSKVCYFIHPHPQDEIKTIE